MRKLIMAFLLVISFIILEINVFAVDSSTKGKTNISYSTCIGLQEGLVSTSGNGYFEHCVKATCSANYWQTQFYISENMVNCSNGNYAKYYQIISDGCSSYNGNCNSSGITNPQYCTIVAYYDCNRTSGGIPFTTTTTPPPLTTTTTTTKKPTTPTTNKPTTTMTQVVKSDNNYLSSLIVSYGEINFARDILDYTLEITAEMTSLTVEATPEDAKASVTIENNDNINVDIPIKINVTAENGDVKVYTINLKYGEINLDNNARLEQLLITDYEIDFNPDVYTYRLKIGDEKVLDIWVTPESEKATSKMSGNEDLKNESVINIIVTAEDGTEATYEIIIEKNALVKEGNNIVGMIIVIIILGVAGFVGFKIFRKMMGNKNGDTKYEYE